MLILIPRSDIAEVIGISPNTLRNWIYSPDGFPGPASVSRGGRWLHDARAVSHWLEKRGSPDKAAILNRWIAENGQQGQLVASEICEGLGLQTTDTYVRRHLLNRIYQKSRTFKRILAESLKELGTDEADCERALNWLHQNKLVLLENGNYKVSETGRSALEIASYEEAE